MADPRTYKWSAAYQDAVLANGPGLVGSRINETLGLIQARLDSQPPVDDAERNEIQDAVLVLHALKAEISRE
jgi:hypothetical protein